MDKLIEYLQLQSDRLEAEIDKESQEITPEELEYSGYMRCIEDVIFYAKGKNDE